MALRRAEPGRIHVGEPLHTDVYDHQGNILLRKGFVVSSDEQLGDLLTRGLYFDDGVGSPRKVAPTLSPFQLVDELQDELDSCLSRFAAEDDFPARIAGLCRKVQQVCVLNADAALGCILLDRRVRYSVRHSLHTAIVCELVGDKKGLADDERQPMIAAALTMNLAMLNLQDQLQTQAKPLTWEQKSAVHSHPERSVELLRAAGVTHEGWLTTVLQHHESIDGKGYPFGLQADEISLPAQLVYLADFYCAKLVNRDYRTPILPNVALRNLFLARGERVDALLAALLIKEMGVYPPGSFLRLANGETGVVTHRGRTAHTPAAVSLLGSHGQPLPVPLRRDCSERMFEVRELVPPPTGLKINRQVLWGYA